ncbi:MAG: tRNA lysidine(34) synthetase TilS [Ruminococcaceae bacterium]|nr:tRNA lysidine(34) synthetase TilS [Oscillospiraceae bacterium]
MEEKVLKAIRYHRLFAPGAYVIVALSGGADSVALFHCLLGLRQALGITVAAAHFEHGLRGEESQQDANFVQELCKSEGIGLYIEYGHMSDKPKPGRLGTEAWARQLRYAFLESLARQHNAVVATAHTLGDNAETVLFNLIRGAGPRGLAGIPPKRDYLVRPLLGVTRAEVEAYCAAHSLAYVTDATNHDDHYSRNRLRNQVLPLLEQAHPGAQQAMARTAADMRVLDDWLATLAGQLLCQAAVEGSHPPDAEWNWQERSALGYADAGFLAPLAADDWHKNTINSFDAALLLAAPQPIRLKALALLAGRAADRAALARLEQVLRGELGAVQLPGGAVARLKKGRLLLVDESLPQPLPAYEVPFSLGEHRLPGGYFLSILVLESHKTASYSKKTAKKGLTFVADYDKISEYGVFRTRRPADRFALPGRGITKPVKKWMQEAGVAPALRDQLPLLAQGSRVLWVWGAGFCAGLEPDDDTHRLLAIHTEPHA